MIAFMTGASGYIGKELLSSLSNKFEKIYVLIRQNTSKDNIEKLSKFSNVILLSGELEATNFNLNSDVTINIKNEITDFIHMAAVYDLSVKNDVAYKSNIMGTQNAIEFANSCKSIKVFHYFSTYAVNSGLDATVAEENLEVDMDFDNYYALTKNRSEYLVRNNFKGNFIRIYRPGIVIGHSKDATIIKEDGPYYFINFFKKVAKYSWAKKTHLFLPLSFNKKAQLPFIPVDYLVMWCSEIISNPFVSKDRIRTYHLFQKPVSLIDFFSFINEKLFLKITFVNLILPKIVVGKFFEFLQMPKELISYLSTKTMYETEHLNTDYPDLPQYSNEILKNALFGSV